MVEGRTLKMSIAMVSIVWRQVLFCFFGDSD